MKDQLSCKGFSGFFLFFSSRIWPQGKPNWELCKKVQRAQYPQRRPSCWLEKQERGSASQSMGRTHVFILLALLHSQLQTQICTATPMGEWTFNIPKMIQLLGQKNQKKKPNCSKSGGITFSLAGLHWCRCRELCHSTGDQTLKEPHLSTQRNWEKGAVEARGCTRQKIPQMREGWTRESPVLCLNLYKYWAHSPRCTHAENTQRCIAKALRTELQYKNHPSTRASPEQ